MSVLADSKRDGRLKAVVRSLKTRGDGTAERSRGVAITSAPADCPPLPIDSIDVYMGSIPVRCHFSYGNIERFAFTILRIRSGSIAGWGETLHPVNATFLPSLRKLAGRDVRSLDALVYDVLNGDDDYRCEAVSIALHDLVARLMGVPLHALLGTQQRAEVPLVPCVFPDSPAEAAELARAYVGAPSAMRHLKIKLLAEADRDLRTVRQIREAVGPSVTLRGDANVGYSFDSLASGLLAEFKRCGLDIAEDPCDASPAKLATLRRADHPLIMVDSAVRSIVGLRGVLDAGAADIVNLHPCQQGSLSEAIAREALCREYNVPVFIGGTGFLGIGTAAYQHLASVIGCAEPCGELGGPFDHGMPKLWKTLPMRDGCVTIPSTAPGIGFDPSIDVLEPYLSHHTQIP